MSAAVEAELATVDDAEREVVEWLAEIAQAPAEHQEAALLELTRSPAWHPALLLLTGWQGAVTREAYRALRRARDADTPGKRWWSCPVETGRASIKRLLGVHEHPAAFYAALPFRTWTDDDDRVWIAGAVGCPPCLDSDALSRWEPFDVRDVILWDPRTDAARLVGEHRSAAMFLMPDLPESRLTVWGSCGAFFRAWAAHRARTGRLAQERAAGRWAHPIAEASDGGLPGGLIVGDIRRAMWPSPAVTSIMAGAGITAAELHLAAIRAAHLPAFGEARA